MTAETQSLTWSMTSPQMRKTFRVAAMLVSLYVSVVLYMHYALAPRFMFRNSMPSITEPATDAPHFATLEPEWEWARETSIVYTWVNGSVSEYRELRAKHGGRHSVGGSRDRDNDDLRYSLRTLAHYMPWHNGTVFIVSPTVPTWLNTSHSRVKWVDQNTIVPLSAQPTFNSNAIEQFLHLIPGLTDRFIQMNDDYMLFRPVHPSDFFTQNRGIRLFLEESVIKPYRFTGKTKPIWLGSTFNSVNTLIEAYEDMAPYEPRYLQHAPFVYYKQAFYNMHQRFYKQFKITSTHKFRNEKDILTPLMHHSYVTQEGSHCCGMDFEIVPKDEAKRMMKFMRWNNKIEENVKSLDFIRKLAPKFFNVNDEMGQDGSETVKAQAQLHAAFQDMFGSFETEFEKQLLN